MERRTLVRSIGLGLLGQLGFVRRAHAESASQAPAQKQAPVTEYDPFVKIANAKRVRIHVNKAPPTTPVAAGGGALHLDMNMVRASLENAIARTRSQKEINAKLRRLLARGTAVQQVEFVMGSGTYYFPEDVEKAITESQRVGVKQSGGQCWVCENVCWLVCTCLENSEQYCREKCRQVCRKYC